MTPTMPLLMLKESAMEGLARILISSWFQLLHPTSDGYCIEISHELGTQAETYGQIEHRIDILVRREQSRFIELMVLLPSASRSHRCRIS